MTASKRSSGRDRGGGLRSRVERQAGSGTERGIDSARERFRRLTVVVSGRLYSSGGSCPAVPLPRSAGHDLIVRGQHGRWRQIAEIVNQAIEAKAAGGDQQLSPGTEIVRWNRVSVDGGV